MSVKKKEKKRKNWFYFLSGELAGMAGILVCHPFDTTKVRIQMLPKHPNISTFKFMGQLIKNEGIITLYRGIAFPFFGFGFIFSTIFGVNGLCNEFCIHRNRINNKINPNELSILQLSLSGTASGMVSSYVRSPIERIKTWSQIHHTNAIISTRDLLRKYGLFNGLIFGIKPTMIREICQFTVYYPIYEYTTRLLSPNTVGNKRKTSNTVIYLSGAAAGVGCWICTYPIDIVKTRIQASPHNKYNGFIHCAKDVYREGGYKIFLNGLVPTMYRAFTLHSMIFLVYERTLEFLDSLYQEKL